MSQTNLAKHRIERHLVVSSFVRDMLHDLGVRTVSDLCELRITAVQKLKGMGVKRIAEVRSLVGAAKKLRKFGKTTEKPAKKTATKEHPGQKTHLVFVPNILRTAFDQLGIDSVESLLSMDCDVLAGQPNFGPKKAAAIIGIHVLYKRLASPPMDSSALRVSDLVPEALLPESCVGRLSMEDFLSGHDGGKLDGKALHETSSLRMLLRTTLHPLCDPLYSKTMEWRDVGLRVPSRVETVANKYNLKTVAELEDLAIFGCVTHSTSKGLTRRSQKDNLGDKSLGSLREELRRLQVMGVREYQKQFVCSLADMDCPITPWFDVPLRVPKRIRDFLNAYQVVTISDVHRMLLRNQVFCNAKKDWLPLSKCRELSESPLEKLRQELRRLQSMGLQAYRKQFVCLLEDIDCPDTPWFDIPLRVSKRIQEFLKAFDVVTISDVHRVVLREQAFCRVRKTWVDFSEIKNFDKRSVGELRDELAQLALLGKERYQFGGSVHPTTLRELATMALKRLDRRELQIVKARCAGAAYAVPARRLSLTGERVRQISMKAFKRLECFQPIATELMKQFIASLPRDVKLNDFELGRQLCLDEKWHFSLLRNLSGYSSERLTSDARR